MNATTPSRHQLLRRTVESRPGSPGEVAVDLWTRFRAGLAARVGEGVFTTMFTRALVLARETAPSLPQPGQPAVWFQDLRASLDALPPAEATEVSAKLFITFTDGLAALIGEAMTLGLLEAAWGRAPASGASRESNHE